MEAVVFVGGVALGQSATSIPIAAIVGIIVGLICGYLIYAFASRSTLRVFLIIMTNFVLLVGVGLFSKAYYDLQENAYNNLMTTSELSPPRNDITTLFSCSPSTYPPGQGTATHS